MPFKSPRNMAPGWRQRMANTLGTLLPFLLLEKDLGSGVVLLEGGGGLMLEVEY